MMKAMKTVSLTFVIFAVVLAFTPVILNAQDAPPAETAPKGPGPKLYNKTTESLLEVRITTAKTFLNLADAAFAKDNLALGKSYLSRSHAEFKKFVAMFPANGVLNNIDKAEAAITQNQYKTAASKTRAAIKEMSKIESFGDMTTVSEKLQEALAESQKKNGSTSLSALTIARENLNSIFMASYDNMTRGEELFNNIKGALAKEEVLIDALTELHNRMNFLYAITSLLYSKVHIDHAQDLLQQNKINNMMKEIRAASNALYKVMMHCQSPDLRSALQNMVLDLDTLAMEQTVNDPGYADQLRDTSILIHNTSITEL